MKKKNLMVNRSEKLSRLVLRHPRWTMLIATAIAGLILGLHTLHTYVKLAESMAQMDASLYSKALAEFRSLYTSEVIDNLDKIPGIDQPHSYLMKHRPIPVPATLSMQLGKKIGEMGDGVSAKLYSKYPFPDREDSGGLRDQFAKDAWKALDMDQDKDSPPFYRIEEIDGQRVLRFATADRMREGCFNCHNHPQSPKPESGNDWEPGDLRGVLEVVYPIDATTEKARSAICGTVIVMALLGCGGMVCLSLVLRTLGKKNREIAESEEKYRSLFENTKDAIIITNKDGLIVEANNALYELFGLDESQCEKLNVKDFYCDLKDRQDVLDLIEKYGYVKDFEAKFKRYDGTAIICMFSAVKHVDKEGNLEYQGILHEVTKQRDIERAFRKSENDLRESWSKLLLIANSVPAFIAYVDKDQRYQFNNKRYEKWLEKSADQIKGKLISEVLTADVYSDIKEHIHSIFQHKRKQTFVRKTEDFEGSVRFVKVSYIPHVENGNDIQGFFILGIDITEQKLKEKFQDWKNDILSLMTLQAPRNVIFETLVNLNEFLEMDFVTTLMIYNDETDTLDLLKSYDKIPEPIKDALKQCQIDPETAVCFEAYRKDKVIYESDLSEIADWPCVELLKKYGVEAGWSAPIRNSKGKTIAVLGTYYNKVLVNEPFPENFLLEAANLAGIVLERESAEKEQRLMNEKEKHYTQQLEIANKELEAFSYSVSHNLKAPLRAINGLSEELQEDYSSDFTPEARDILDDIRDSSTSMGNLIESLLNFFRLGPHPVVKTEIDMNKLVEAVIDDLKHECADRNIEWTIHELPSARGDEQLLKEAMINIVENSIKFTINRKVAKIEIGCNSETGNPEYYIKDDGIGFDMDYVDKIFDFFERLHTDEGISGTGVGLAMAQRIIRKHGGRIKATGKPQDGAQISFTLK